MRVLVVEDEPNLRLNIAQALAGAGYAVDSAADGQEALHLGSVEPYDVLVLDLGLPVLDGLSVLRRWRAAGIATPVLVLTARDLWHEKVAGIDAGADDYLTKPFDFTELTARLRALLRRYGGTAAPVLHAGDVELDPATREVRHAGEVVTMTPKEYALLEYLLRNLNRPLSRATLMEHVWGIRFDPGTNVIDVFINSLRNKLDPERQLIQTVRGVGYMVKTAEREDG